MVLLESALTSAPSQFSSPLSTVVFVLCHASHWPEPSHTTKETKPGCTARIHCPDTLIAAPALLCVDVPPGPPLSAQPHHLLKLDDPKWTEMDRKIRGQEKEPNLTRTNSEQLLGDAPNCTAMRR